LTALILPRGTGERNGFGAFREEPPPDDESRGKAPWPTLKKRPGPASDRLTMS